MEVEEENVQISLPKGWDDGQADPVSDIRASMETMMSDTGYRPPHPSLVALFEKEKRRYLEERK